MKKLKIAVIGCGGIAKNAHFPAYEKMEEIEIVAFCDVILERAEEAVKQFGGGVAYTDYREVLKRTDLDAIDICTPNIYHSEIAVAALERGFHVFCEKPDAVSVAECLRMKDVAEKSGKVLMVMRNNRYLSTSAYLKQFIQDGKMGEIYAGRCGWQRRRGIPGRGGWFTTKALSGGGPLIDLGVHMIDLSIWLMGNPKPVAVSGCTYRKFADSTISDSVNSQFGDQVEDGVFDVEDLAMGMIRFDNGACLQIEFSWASNVEKEEFFVELRGTKAGSKWTSTTGLNLYTEEYGRTVDIHPHGGGGQFGTPHEANLRHFADVLLHGAEPMFTPEQGLDMIRILEAMYRSADLGEEVKL